MAKTKRLLDVILSILLIIITSPVMAAIAVAIKLDTPGPVLYSRLPNRYPVYRIGAHGTPFRYFKFRSMIHGNSGQADEITRVGNFIRRWHLDELPELFMVLSGRMSLVGPRPCTYESLRFYPDDYFLDWQVKPGMTGPSQLRGKSISVAEKIETDLRYIKNRTVVQDFIFIARTPVTIFRHRHQPHF